MTISSGASYLASLNNAGTTATPTVPTNNQTLSQADFLQLLTTQMANQDPLNPTDDTAMISQMAQISQTSGIAQMNQTLSSIQSSLSSSRIGDAASWIGKSALVPSTTAAALSDGSYSGTVTLPSAASNVNISLVNSSGTVVYSGSATNVPAGAIPFNWNGQDSSGNAVAGPLSISVSAQSSSGQSISATTSSWTTISGVQSPASGSTQFVTPLGTIDPTTVLQIS